MIVLQADTTDLIEKGLNITPYSATAFGALIVVLCVAVVMLWRKNIELDTEIRSVTNRAIDVLVRVSQRLDDQQEIIKIISEMSMKIDHLRDAVNSRNNGT